MKKLLLLAGSLFAVSFLASGDEAVIKVPDRPEFTVRSVNADSLGNLEYSTAKSGDLKLILPRGKYSYAWIPRPKALEEAASLLKTNPVAAAEAFKLGYEKYKLLGWDVYCISGEAEAMAKLGMKKEAIRKLAQLKDYKCQNERLRPMIEAANRLTLQLCIETGEYALAEQLVRMMRSSPDESVAVFGYMRHGDMLRKQGKIKEASRIYLQAYLLFPESPSGRENLRSLVAALEELKDPRSANFAEILKKDESKKP